MTSSRLGTYELIESLHQGGLAEVFLARRVGQTPPDPITVKRLDPKAVADPKRGAHIPERAREAMALQHPSILRILELGEDGGVPFLATEYLAGRPLRALLAALAKKKERLELPLALLIASRIGEALVHAHAASAPGQAGSPGVVHAAVSPDSIRVGLTGEVKLEDFGFMPANWSQRSVTKNERLGFLSPEQMSGAPLTPATDLYALGLVLYELATGRRLYGPAPRALRLQELLNGATPPFDGELPQALIDLLRTALARKPEERFQSAEALLEALRRIEDASPGGAGTAAELAALMSRTFPDAHSTEAQRQTRLVKGPPLSMSSPSSPHPEDPASTPVAAAEAGSDKTAEETAQDVRASSPAGSAGTGEGSESAGTTESSVASGVGPRGSESPAAGNGLDASLKAGAAAGDRKGEAKAASSAAAGGSSPAITDLSAGTDKGAASPASNADAAPVSAQVGNDARPAEAADSPSSTSHALDALGAIAEGSTDAAALKRSEAAPDSGGDAVASDNATGPGPEASSAAGAPSEGPSSAPQQAAAAAAPTSAAVAPATISGGSSETDGAKAPSPSPDSANATGSATAASSASGEVGAEAPVSKPAPVAPSASSAPKPAPAASSTSSAPKLTPVAPSASSAPKPAPVAPSSAPKLTPVAPSASSAPKPAPVAPSTSSAPKPAPTAASSQVPEPAAAAKPLPGTEIQAHSEVSLPDYRDFDDDDDEDERTQLITTEMLVSSLPAAEAAAVAATPAAPAPTAPPRKTAVVTRPSSTPRPTGTRPGPTGSPGTGSEASRSPAGRTGTRPGVSDPGSGPRRTPTRPPSGEVRAATGVRRTGSRPSIPAPGRAATPAKETRRTSAQGEAPGQRDAGNRGTGRTQTPGSRPARRPSHSSIPAVGSVRGAPTPRTFSASHPAFDAIKEAESLPAARPGAAQPKMEILAANPASTPEREPSGQRPLVPVPSSRPATKAPVRSAANPGGSWLASVPRSLWVVTGLVLLLLMLGLGFSLRSAPDSEVVVHVTPAQGALITLDGRQLQSGQPIALPPGEYELVAIAEGHKRYSQRITVFEDAEQAVYPITLEPDGASVAPAGTGPGAVNAGTFTVRFTTSTPGVEIWVEGTSVGTAPEATAILPIGRPHRYEARAKGFEATMGTVGSFGDPEVTVQLTLQPAVDRIRNPNAPPTGGTGRLVVATEPNGAEVYVNGVPTGRRTPITSVDPLILPVGKHRLRFALGERVSRLQNVTLERGQTILLDDVAVDQTR